MSLRRKGILRVKSNEKTLVWRKDNKIQKWRFMARNRKKALQGKSVSKITIKIEVTSSYFNN